MLSRLTLLACLFARCAPPRQPLCPAALTVHRMSGGAEPLRGFGFERLADAVLSKRGSVTRHSHRLSHRLSDKCVGNPAKPTNTAVKPLLLDGDGFANIPTMN